jgi:prepilin-type N-terminal cleavage/methylation domain-containing protein
MTTRKKSAPPASARRRRGRAGFTMIETMIAAAIFGTIVFAVAWLGGEALRLSNLVTTNATMQSAGRLRLDQFMQDVQDSSAVLTSYTTGTTTYTSSTTGTLVLAAPSYTYDSSGNPLNTYTDHIIYHLVGASAPYTLNRVVLPASGSPRAAVPDTVIARNVQSATFTCLVSSTWTGDGSSTTFALDTSVAGSGATLVESVTANGAAVSLGSGASQAHFTSSALQFGTAPADQTTIDALYSVDPSASASYVTGVRLDLILSTTDPSQRAAAQTQTVELSSRSNLRNH